MTNWPGDDGRYTRIGAKGGRTPIHVPDSDSKASIDWRRMGKFLLNVVVKSGLLLLFNLLGWMKLAPVVPSWGFGGVALTAGVLALMFTLILLGIYRAIYFGAAVTCGLFVLLVPAIGYFSVVALVKLTPQYVTVSNNAWWAMLGMGTLLWLFSVPMRRRMRTILVHEGHEVVDGEVK